MQRAQKYRTTHVFSERVTGVPIRTLRVLTDSPALPSYSFRSLEQLPRLLMATTASKR